MTDATWALFVMLAGWAIVIVAVACLAYVGFCSRRNSKALARAKAVHDKILRKEHLARLRHRDFDAFCTEVNNMRAQRNEKPIPLDLLRKVQFNLMYTIDED